MVGLLDAQGETVRLGIARRIESKTAELQTLVSSIPADTSHKKEVNMPYIAPKARKQLDPLIDALAERIVAEAKADGNDAAFAGLLNYGCTRLALQIVRLQFGKIRYWLIALITGTFQNVAQEFYRRAAAPYEEKQIEKNGDIDLYKAIVEEG